MDLTEGLISPINFPASLSHMFLAKIHQRASFASPFFIWKVFFVLEGCIENGFQLDA